MAASTDLSPYFAAVDQAVRDLAAYAEVPVRAVLAVSDEHARQLAAYRARLDELWMAAQMRAVSYGRAWQDMHSYLVQAMGQHIGILRQSTPDADTLIEWRTAQDDKREQMRRLMEALPVKLPEELRDATRDEGVLPTWMPRADRRRTLYDAPARG